MEEKQGKIRKRSSVLGEMIEKIKNNPIISEETLPVQHITTKEHIKELQEILVQACIDYINKNGLTDIFCVSFNADALAESATFGSWQPCTDSWIGVKGLEPVIYTRKDGSTITSGQTYNIGEYM